MKNSRLDLVTWRTACLKQSVSRLEMTAMFMRVRREQCDFLVYDSALMSDEMCADCRGGTCDT